ncbi:MAG: hypothetical protein KTR32_03430 [Granulosicoccus sp.]|nr:hypothetical protein [Granulosicoccus sp.]
MNIHRHSHLLARALTPIIFTSTLVACGSSELSSSVNSLLSDRVVTRGTITSIDTVSVNGRSLSTSSASIYLDDQTVDKTALRTGMQVIVERQSETAINIHYEEDVKGPVDAVDAMGNLSVMGQSVAISSSTLFDSSPNGAISAGDIVEVSGLRDDNDLLHATFIEKKQSISSAFKVQGPVRQLDTTNKTLVIGDLVIDYQGARFDDFSEASLIDGVFVEVKDESRLYEPGSLFLTATKIEPYRDVLTVSGESSSGANTQRTEIEIEAFVTHIVSDDIFELGSLAVRILPTTRFRDGQRQQIQINTRLEVEGWLNSDGVLEAWEIEFEDGSDYFDSDDDSSNSSSGSSAGDDDDDDTEVELEGIVSALNVDEGLLVINGIEIRVGNRTEFENRQGQYITRNQFFNLIDVGSTVVKVEWEGFTNYTAAPHEVEIEV